MRGRSFKNNPYTLRAVVVILLLLSTFPIASAHTSMVTVDSGVPDIPGAGVLTGIGVVFLFRQLTDTQIAFTSTILGFAESRGINITYLWDFGDNSTKSTQKNPIHEYDYAGWNADFNVTLETCTERGRCAEVYKNVHIIRWSMVFVTLGVILSVSAVAIIYAVRERRKGR